jgi:hypothetical protein
LDVDEFLTGVLEFCFALLIGMTESSGGCVTSVNDTAEHYPVLSLVRDNRQIIV